MAAPTIAIKLTLENNQFKAQVVNAQEALRAFGTNVKQSTDRARTGFDQLNNRVGAVRNSLAALATTATFGLLLRELSQALDSYSNLSARLKLVTNSSREFALAQAGIVRIANTAQAPIEAVGTLYVRTATAIQRYSGSQEDALKVTSAVTNALRLNGATAAEASSVITQFSQALAKGTLNGDEFRTLGEAAPQVLDAISKSLGKGRDELFALAEAGELTAQRIVTALADAEPEFSRLAKSIPKTISGSFTELNNNLVTFAGSSQAAAGFSRTLIGALQLLAKNIDFVASALAALAIGAFAAGLGRAVGALVALGSAMRAAAGAAAGLRIALAGVGGIPGLIVGGLVALGASLGLSKAGADEAAESTDVLSDRLDRLRESLNELSPAAKRLELSALSDQLRRLNNERKELEGDAGGFFSRLFFTESDKAKLDDTLARIRLVTPAIQQLEDSLQNVAPTIGGKAIKDFDDFVSQFDTRREKLAKAIEKLKQLARARGLDEAGEQFRAALAKLRASFNKDNNEDTTQRLDRFRSSLDLLQQEFDAKNRSAQEALDRRLRANLVSFEEYFARKASLETAALQKQVANRQQEIRAIDSLVGQLNKSLAGQEDADKITAANKQLDELLKRRDELTTGLVVLEQQLGDVGANAASRTAEATKNLIKDRSDLSEQLKRSTGDELGAQFEALERERLELRERFKFDAQSLPLVDRLIDNKKARAELAEAERLFNETLQRMRLAIDSVNNLRDAGTISGREAQRRITEEQLRSIPVLRQQADVVGSFAGRFKDASLKATELDQVIDQIASSTDVAGQKLGEAIRSGLSTAFSDVLTGAKSFGDALASLFNSIANSIIRSFADDIADGLFDAFKGLNKGGEGGLFGSIGSFIASFFHDGGIVGAGGLQRRVPALAFAGAPRLHSGGFAGLAANEVPAILERGEEVLTRNDPRHARNGGGSVVVNIQTADLNSFKGSEGQVSAGIAAALRRAQLRNG